MQTHGSMTVQAPRTVGVFAYLSPATRWVVNTALLDGSAVSHALVAARVTSDDRYVKGNQVVKTLTPDSCDSASAAFTLSGCSVQLTTAHATTAEDQVVSVHYAEDGTSFERQAKVNVYAFGTISLALADPTLNRFHDASGGEISACASGTHAAAPYQRTTVSATVAADGHTFDLTPLVSFVTDAPAIARMGTGAYWRVVEG